MQWDQGAKLFLEALSSDKPTPGGGAAAAMTGAMGCSLVMMAASTTLKRKNTSQEAHNVLENVLPILRQGLEQLNYLIRQDAAAYEEYLKAYRLPKTDFARETLVQDALWNAACVPADTASICKQILCQADMLAPFIDKIIISDMYCACHLLNSAIACCTENIRANLIYITEQKRAEKLKQLLDFFEKGTNNESNPA